MAGIDDILQNLPINDIARTLGVDPETAQAAILEGGQTILSGLKKETETPEGAAALTNALDQHAGDKKISSADDIDEEDGKGILGHVFGGQLDQVTANLGGSGGAASGIDFGKLLPLLAPIIMNYIANQKKANEKESSGGGLDIGGLLGGVLGGGSSSGSSSSKSGGFDIMGALGGLFGKK